MTRDTVASVTSAASLPQLRFRMLCRVDSTSGGTVRACSGGNFVFDGVNTWSPIGAFGSVDAIQEDSDPFPRAVRIKLAAVNTGQIVDMVNEQLFNKPVKFYRCFLDDTLAVIGTPQLWWSGKINTVNMVTLDPQLGNYYEIECESRLRRSARAQYFNTQTLQQVLGSSGDTFFNYVQLIPLRKAPWGSLPYSVGAGQPYNNEPGTTTGGQPGRRY